MSEWTKTRPTAPGWYYAATNRVGAGESVWIQKVHERDGAIVVLVETLDGPEPWPIDAYDWWWSAAAMPLPEPPSEQAAEEKCKR